MVTMHLLSPACLVTVNAHFQLSERQAMARCLLPFLMCPKVISMTKRVSVSEDVCLCFNIWYVFELSLQCNLWCLFYAIAMYWYVQCHGCNFLDEIMKQSWIFILGRRALILGPLLVTQWVVLAQTAPSQVIDFDILDSYFVVYGFMTIVKLWGALFLCMLILGRHKSNHVEPGVYIWSFW